MLSLESIRHMANKYDCKEIQFNVKSYMISFINNFLPCRINIYYTTGTVAT